MRLIDADAINFNDVFGGNSDFARDISSAAQNLIDIQPTIEAEPIKRGHIVTKKRVIGGVENHKCPECSCKWQTDNRVKVQELLCSECGKILADNYLNYCPNCGAKMEE